MERIINNDLDNLGDINNEKVKSNKITVPTSNNTKVVSISLDIGLYFITYTIEFNGIKKDCFIFYLHDDTSDINLTPAINHYNPYDNSGIMRSCEYTFLTLKKNSTISIQCFQTVADNLQIIAAIRYRKIK